MSECEMGRIRMILFVFIKPIQILLPRHDHRQDLYSPTVLRPVKPSLSLVVYRMVGTNANQLLFLRLIREGFQMLTQELSHFDPVARSAQRGKASASNIAMLKFERDPSESTSYYIQYLFAKSEAVEKCQEWL